MNQTNKALYELIKNCWRALKVYNQEGDKEAIQSLRRIQEQVEVLIKSIKEEERKK